MAGHVGTRVILTDGVRYLNLGWIHHSKTDIYAGFLGQTYKVSYHASGQVWQLVLGAKNNRRTTTIPPSALDGSYVFHAASLFDAKEFFASFINEFEYKRTFKRNTLLVDTRGFAAGENVIISFGAVSRDHVSDAADPIAFEDGTVFETSQLNLLTEHEPFAFIKVSRFRKV